MIITALNWLLFSWLIWPIIALGLFVPNYIVKADKDFAGIAFLPIGIAIGAAWWRWPAIFPHTWGGAALAAGLYLAAGGVYSAFKYLQTLRAFKAQAEEALKGCSGNEGDRKARLRSAFCYSSGLSVRFDENGAQLDWARLPIANWWIWFPYFLCGTAFDFVSNLGDRLVGAFKGFYQGLAKRFAVKL